jgi:hypothetical protein
MSRFPRTTARSLHLSAYRRLWDTRWTCISFCVRTIVYVVHGPPNCRTYHWPHCQQVIISYVLGKTCLSQNVWRVRLRSTSPHGLISRLAFRRWSVRIAIGTPAVVTEGLHAFPQSLQPNYRIILRLCYDLFLSNLIQLVHQSSYNWRRIVYILTASWTAFPPNIISKQVPCRCAFEQNKSSCFETPGWKETKFPQELQTGYSCQIPLKVWWSTRMTGCLEVSYLLCLHLFNAICSRSDYIS